MPYFSLPEYIKYAYLLKALQSNIKPGHLWSLSTQVLKQVTGCWGSFKNRITSTLWYGKQGSHCLRVICVEEKRKEKISSHCLLIDQSIALVKIHVLESHAHSKMYYKCLNRSYMVYKGSAFLKLEDNMWHQFMADSTLTGVPSLSLYYNIIYNIIIYIIIIYNIIIYI